MIIQVVRFVNNLLMKSLNLDIMYEFESVSCHTFCYCNTARSLAYMTGKLLLVRRVPYFLCVL